MTTRIGSPCLGELPAKRRCCEMDHPEKVKEEDLDGVVHRVLQKVEALSSLCIEENFRSKILHAVKVWWIKADHLSDRATALKVRRCCMRMLVHAEIFRQASEPPQWIQIHLAQETVSFNEVELEVWKMASPVMNGMLSHRLKELRSGEIQLHEISGDILRHISLMLREPSVGVGECDARELFQAVHFLQIEFLEKKIAELIKDQLYSTKFNEWADVLNIYGNFLSFDSISGRAITNACLLWFLGRFIYGPFISSTESSGLNNAYSQNIQELVPGFLHLLQGNAKKSLDSFHTVASRTDDLPHLLAAWAHMQESDFERVEEKIQCILKKNSKSLLALLLQVRLYKKKN